MCKIYPHLIKFLLNAQILHLNRYNDLNMHTSTTQCYLKNKFLTFVKTIYVQNTFSWSGNPKAALCSFIRYIHVNRIWSDISICFHFISFAEKAVRKLRTLKGISYNYKRQQSSFFKHSNLYLIPVKFWCEIISSVFVIQNVWIPGQLSMPLWMHRAGRSKKCGRFYRVGDSGK